VNALPALRLIAITDLGLLDGRQIIDAWEQLATSAQPGSVALDLRAPGASARALLELGEELKAVALWHEQRLLVSERLDLALLLDADALHLGENSVASSRVRSTLGDKPLLRACHDVTQVDAVDAEMVLLSPILEARKGKRALGLAALTEGRSRLDSAGRAQRLFALGGVDAARAKACLEAGAHGVAAISGVFGGADPKLLLAAVGILRPIAR
jgi:thiamine-phosphate pyrophosphorylase